jgi:hypothetical protein
MAGKIYNKASRDIKLRSSGLFVAAPYLEDALLIAVVHFVYVLYQREDNLYYFIKLLPETGYELLLQSYQESKLSIDQIVDIVESLPKESMDGRYDQY